MKSSCYEKGEVESMSFCNPSVSLHSILYQVYLLVSSLLVLSPIFASINMKGYDHGPCSPCVS
jgi:hypothetical protein